MADLRSFAAATGLTYGSAPFPIHDAAGLWAVAEDMELSSSMRCPALWLNGHVLDPATDKGVERTTHLLLEYARRRMVYPSNAREV